MDSKRTIAREITAADIEKDIEARSIKHPLTPYQSYIVDYQMYTPMSTMWNFGSLYKFDTAKYEPEKLASAVETAIKAHPALSTVIGFNDDGSMFQQYKADFADKVTVEKTGEFEFAELKNGLVSPFKIVNSRLYRAKIFTTEKAGYLFLDVHHVIFDKPSLRKLISDIVKAYNGTEIEHDFYYLTLAENEAAIGTEAYAECKKFFEREYDGKNAYSRRPVFDDDSRENTLGELIGKVAVDENALTKVEKDYGADDEAVFTLASMITVGMYNEEPNVIISWLYDGRDNAVADATVGLLLSDLRISSEVTKKLTLKNAYADVTSQMANAVKHKVYPYSMMSANAAVNDVFRFIYSPDNDVADGIAFEKIEIRRNKAATENVIDLELIGKGAKRTAIISYNACRYSERSMSYFLDTFTAVTNALYTADGNATVKDVIKKAKKQLGEFSWYLAWIK